MKDLYSENYKTLMKEIEDDTKKWKDTSCSWIGRNNIVKISILSKAIYRFNAILSKYPWIFHRSRTNNLTIYMETQKTSNSQNNLEKEESWRYHSSWFQTILFKQYIYIYSNSNCNSVELAQKQTHRSMKQKREPRNEHTLIWAINLWQRRQKYITGKRQPLQ